MTHYDPGEHDIWLKSGQLALTKGDTASASSAFLIAGLFTPDRTDVWTGLASSLGNPAPQDVLERCVARILTLDPINIAASLMRLDGWAAKGHSGYRAQAMRCMAVMPADAEPYFHFARAVISSEPEQALPAVRRSLHIDPTDPHGCDRLTANAGQSQSLSPAFVAQLFDKYADSYDDHLVEKLSYSGPREITRALSELSHSHRYTKTVDLGCGTGLCEPILRAVSDTLIGVDLSSSMLRHAQQNRSYDYLYEGDIVSWLQAEAGLDLLVAAEVSPYIGDLDPLFRAAAGAAHDGSLFVLTYRVGDGDGFELSGEKVYRHAPSYVRRVADQNGWVIHYSHKATVHFAGDEPVVAETLRLHRKC